MRHDSDEDGEVTSPVKRWLWRLEIVVVAGLVGAGWVVTILPLFL